jgi:hypothetical protein
MIDWLSRKNKFTRNDLMGKFELSEKEHLRPLLSQLQDDRLVKQTGKGFAPLPRLINLARILETAGKASDNAAGQQQTIV